VAAGGDRSVAAFEAAEPWVDEQVGRRLAGIGHVFPGYTYPLILDLPYEVWVGLARQYDRHVEDLENKRRKSRRGRGA
jgi:hypothetical protein